MNLTPRHIELLRAAMLAPASIIGIEGEASAMQAAGLVTIKTVRKQKVMALTDDGRDVIRVAKGAEEAPQRRAGFAGITASECDAFLRSLPPVPLHGEGADHG